MQDERQIFSPADGAINSMRRKNRLFLTPASRLLVVIVYIVLLAPSLGLVWLFDTRSDTAVLTAFVLPAVLALVVTALIERLLRRWFFL